MAERNPTRIAINMSEELGTADGLSKTSYDRLVKELGPEFASRLVSSEKVVSDFRSGYTVSQVVALGEAGEISRRIAERALSNEIITPGVTTLADVAEMAKLPLGGIYYYFKTKDALAEAVTEDAAVGQRGVGPGVLCGELLDRRRGVLSQAGGGLNDRHNVRPRPSAKPPVAGIWRGGDGRKRGVELGVDLGLLFEGARVRAGHTERDEDPAPFGSLARARVERGHPLGVEHPGGQASVGLVVPVRQGAQGGYHHHEGECRDAAHADRHPDLAKDCPKVTDRSWPRHRELPPVSRVRSSLVGGRRFRRSTAACPGCAFPEPVFGSAQRGASGGDSVVARKTGRWTNGEEGLAGQR